MGHQTVKVANEPDSMANFIATEGIYVLQANNTIEQIGNIALGSYSGGGASVVTVVKGQAYIWTKGASDTNLVVDANTTLTATNGFLATGTTVTLNGTNSAAITATLIPDFAFQKLWLYPAKAVAAGILTANAGNVSVGKSGSAATKYTPDLLQPTDLPIKYELPLGQKMKLSQVILQGAAGDGVYYQFT